MLRAQRLTLGGRHLVYFDAGGDGAPLLALHGHFGRARAFDRLAEALAPQWRVVALEQRGHGRSSPAEDYDRAGYVADAAFAIASLGLAPAVVLGHSLGGINAYQLAARHPDLVRAVIVEDAPAVVGERPDILVELGRRWTSVRALREAIGDDAYLLESAFEDDDGWGLRFDPAAINRSRALQVGDHWADWLASSHPLLLLRGGDSDFLPRALAAEMASRRPNTRLVEFPGAGHHVHDDDFEGFAAAVRSFLEALPELQNETGRPLGAR
jgi:pimeloyl-ACP methyl ester carboxylesterase